MRKPLMLTLCTLISVAPLAMGAAAKKQRRSTPHRQSRSSSTPTVGLGQRMLSEALTFVRNGQYEQAAVRLQSLSRRSDLAKERMQIKYILGVTLMELKLYQTAAFQFVDVIRQGDAKYTRQAIEKLLIAADELGDDTLLNYAIAKVKLQDFPERYKDIIYYRLGEIKLKRRQYGEAVQSFGRVRSSSRYYDMAKFNQGLAYLEQKDTAHALQVFQGLYSARSQAPVTDVNKVSAILAIARTYYQAGEFDEAIEWYHKVPRDTDNWHEALFEQTWADLRAAKFRSALSNFQSLHSSYYEDFYIPESLLLRAIVYLYICKYEEMDKVLDLFDHTYDPIRDSLNQFVRNNNDPVAYYNEIDKAAAVRRGDKTKSVMKIPYSAARFVLDEGDVKRELTYLRNLFQEKKRIDSNPLLARTSLAVYANKILGNRARNTRISIGEMVKSHLISMRSDLRDLYEQAGFIRYEMINGKKEALRKKIAGKQLPTQLDEDKNRNFYIQNGYEYWPFEGEYWLDEIGNYQYLGKQSCE
jgi:outer membrane protein assembly factor BamD (BamD/ComL family)